MDIFGNTKMTNLTNILRESQETYQFTALIKNYKSINKSDIFNVIRAVPYVIRIKVVEDPRLADINRRYDYEYALIKVKYLNVFGTPNGGIKAIKNIVLNGNKGFHKVKGVISFKPMLHTLHKVTK